MEKLSTFSKKGPGADCGSDHEPLTAKFRLKSKKVGKTIRPVRYDLNQIGKFSNGHRTGRGQFSFQSQRKAMPKKDRKSVV